MTISKILYSLSARHKGTNAPTEKKNKILPGQIVARHYCLAASILFVIQGIVALTGALDMVVPDLPSPIPFQYGRSIHLGLAILWPLIGTLGIVHFSVIKELETDIASVKLQKFAFWLLLLSSLSIYGTLALRIGNGREYFEGLPVFYGGITAGIALAFFNLVKTHFKAPSRITPASAIMTTGVILLALFLAPNVLFYQNQIADEAFKFWVVHLWEELAFELTTAGFISSFYVNIRLGSKKEMERWLYLEGLLTIVGGLFGTGHHYFWIGFPPYWLILGTLFSVIEIIPVLLLIHLTYKGLKSRPKLNKREKLSLWFILSSLFYHLTGASLLGLIITVPWVNLYMHGTLMTSGHAHLALFGSLGFLVLGGSYYCLSYGSQPTQKGYIIGTLGVLFLNGGLLVMSLSLLLGGLIQIYLYRVIGTDFITSLYLIKPYLIVRFIGGGLFFAGDILFAWLLYQIWRDPYRVEKHSI